MAGDGKCCSRGFEYVGESKRRPGRVAVLGALGILGRDKGFRIGEGKWRWCWIRAIGKDLGLLSAGNRKYEGNKR